MKKDIIIILFLVAKMLLVFTSCEDDGRSKNIESTKHVDLSTPKSTPDKNQLEEVFYEALSAFENGDHYLSGLHLEKGVEYMQDFVIEVEGETKREVYAHIDSLLVIVQRLKNEENVDEIELKKALEHIILHVIPSHYPGARHPSRR